PEEIAATAASRASGIFTRIDELLWSVRGELGTRRRVLRPAGREIARTDGDWIPIPEVVERVHEAALRDVDAAVAAAVELVERVGAVLLDRELRSPSGAYGQGHAVDSMPWNWMLPIWFESIWCVWP